MPRQFATKVATLYFQYLLVGIAVISPGMVYATLLRGHWTPAGAMSIAAMLGIPLALMAWKAGALILDQAGDRGEQVTGAAALLKRLVSISTSGLTSDGFRFAIDRAYTETLDALRFSRLD